jgi:uncharacterized protein
MITRILLILSLCGTVAYAAESPSPGPAATSDIPSEASIKQLLETAQVHKLLDSVMTQMDSMLQQTIKQTTQGRKVSPKIQKDIDKRQAEVMAILKDLLDWKKLEPMYTRVYQKSFNQQEVDGMIAFYQTPAGQAVITKMPLVMQNTMNEMQELMSPVIQKMQKMQQDVIAELKAEEGKKGG